DVLSNAVARERIAKALEQRSQLFGGEQEEQHQHVGLLADLVLVRAVALGLEDAVEALDVAVLGSIPQPVELLEVLPAVELQDDVAAHGNVEVRGDVLPARHLRLAQVEIQEQLALALIVDTRERLT